MKDNLGNRIKTYENVSRHYLTRRTPTIIRIDGCHFHTFTRGFDKPYDEVLCSTMQNTMKYLCANIQGCVLGYTQSDEITLVLCDYKKLTTAAWFDNNVQKMCSVSASLATLAFNKFFSSLDIVNQSYQYQKANAKWATFDSRVFNIPKEEVCNCLIWRQKDAIRNSIQGLGHNYFSNKELEGKSCEDIQDMLYSKYGVNWNTDVPIKFKRGSCCIKTESGWEIDNDIPLFTSDRGYIESRIVFEDTLL